MIKAIALDIDGVIVGTKRGINQPNPSILVSKALHKVHGNGVPVVFISAKTSFAVSQNIKHIGVDNPHISDSGAVLLNPIRGELLEVKAISSIDAQHILSSIPDVAYVNLFTTRDYFILKKVQEKFPEFVKKYSVVMQRSPIAVENFNQIIKNETVIKINIFVFNTQEKNKIAGMILKSKGKFTYKWSVSPYLYPAEAMIITCSGVSKRSGLETLAKYLKVSLSEILGIGDQLQDWDFMEVCGYKATLANGSKELKSKLDFSDNKQFMGGHVDQDGIIDILKHFKLL